MALSNAGHCQVKKKKPESKAIPNVKATENVTMRNDQHKVQLAKI